MPNNRLVWTLALALALPLWALAQAPAPTPAPAPAAAPVPGSAPAAPVPAPEPPTEAEQALDAAIAKVKALKSVSAEITEAVDMLGQHFTVAGQYKRAGDYRILL